MLVNYCYLRLLISPNFVENLYFLIILCFSFPENTINTNQIAPTIIHEFAGHSYLLFVGHFELILI